MKIFIGIDPGMKGGIGIIRGCGDVIACYPMPATRKESFDILKGFEGADVTAVIEKVGSMPKQGVSSTFKFSKGYGELLGICTALGFKILEPTPQMWRKVALVGTNKGKLASIQRCENLFPKVNLILPRCRTPHDGIAEALLMAEYGRRQGP